MWGSFVLAKVAATTGLCRSSLSGRTLVKLVLLLLCRACRYRTLYSLFSPLRLLSSNIILWINPEAVNSPLYSSSVPRDDGFQQVVNGRKVSNPQIPNLTQPPQSELVPQAEDFEKDLQKRLKVVRIIGRKVGGRGDA